MVVVTILFSDTFANQPSVFKLNYIIISSKLQYVHFASCASATHNHAYSQRRCWVMILETRISYYSDLQHSKFQTCMIHFSFLYGILNHSSIADPDYQTLLPKLAYLLSYAIVIDGLFLERGFYRYLCFIAAGLKVSVVFVMHMCCCCKL